MKKKKTIKIVNNHAIDSTKNKQNPIQSQRHLNLRSHTRKLETGTGIKAHLNSEHFSIKRTSEMVDISAGNSAKIELPSKFRLNLAIMEF